MDARTALVTGANRGIGFEVCRKLAAAGVPVVLTSRDGPAAEEAARRLSAEGLEVRSEMMDVTSGESVAACARRLGGSVEILVNNAGAYPKGTVLDAPWETFREAFETNFFGALRCCRAFVPGMVQRGRGRVVNVTSGYGLLSRGLGGPAPYSLSKAALGALTVQLAGEVRGDVKVNAVDPGWVRTRMGGPTAPVPPGKAADEILRLATLPPDGPSGRCFHDGRVVDW